MYRRGSMYAKNRGEIVESSFGSVPAIADETDTKKCVDAVQVGGAQPPRFY